MLICDIVMHCLLFFIISKAKNVLLSYSKHGHDTDIDLLIKLPARKQTSLFATTADYFFELYKVKKLPACMLSNKVLLVQF